MSMQFRHEDPWTSDLACIATDQVLSIPPNSHRRLALSPSQQKLETEESLTQSFEAQSWVDFESSIMRSRPLYSKPCAKIRNSFTWSQIGIDFEALSQCMVDKRIRHRHPCRYQIRATLPLVARPSASKQSLSRAAKSQSLEAIRIQQTSRQVG